MSKLRAEVLINSIGGASMFRAALLIMAFAVAFIFASKIVDDRGECLKNGGEIKKAPTGYMGRVQSRCSQIKSTNGKGI